MKWSSKCIYTNCIPWNDLQSVAYVMLCIKYSIRWNFISINIWLHAHVKCSCKIVCHVIQLYCTWPIRGPYSYTVHGPYSYTVHGPYVAHTAILYMDHTAILYMDHTAILYMDHTATLYMDHTAIGPYSYTVHGPYNNTLLCLQLRKPRR